MTYVTTRELAEVAFATLFTTLVWFLARRYPSLTSKAVAFFRALAARSALFIVITMLLPLALRLAMLPWVAPPEPFIHDEFSHLLVADTLGAGRLANPPHPLWRHLETIYVLQQPTYSSVYPIGQGVILAVGKVLIGSSWAGVLLSVMLMSGAITWMLYGCVPPAWAALGGLLAALDYGLAPQWIDSYWGGAFCAFGGALFFGAICRLRGGPSRTLALLLGLGWLIMWLVRPFESVLPLMISWALIAAWVIYEPQRWRGWVAPVVIIALIQAIAGGVTALHNRAVTGSFTTLPYRLSQQLYGVPQSFLWEKPIQEPALRFAEAKDVYWMQRTVKEKANENPILRQLSVGGVHTMWEFFVTPWYSLPILLLVFLFEDRQVILACAMMVGALGISALYPFSFAHYFAAYSCLIVFLIIRGMMKLSEWSFLGRAVGPLVVLFLMSGGFAMALRIIPMKEVLHMSPATAATLRTQVSDRLIRLGGRHVVFVRYGAHHSFHDEWVYNAAEIDASPIVWCRATDRADEAEVTQYYRDRRFWIADVDNDTVRVSSYQPGAEVRDWVLQGKPRG